MGNLVVHWELWSQDPEGVSDFYAKAFGWEMQNIPELNYRMAETGGVGGINGGIMKPEDGAMSMGLGHKAGGGLGLFNASLRDGTSTWRIVLVKRPLKQKKKKR